MVWPDHDGVRWLRIGQQLGRLASKSDRPNRLHVKIGSLAPHGRFAIPPNAPCTAPVRRSGVRHSDHPSRRTFQNFGTPPGIDGTVIRLLASYPGGTLVDSGTKQSSRPLPSCPAPACCCSAPHRPTPGSSSRASPGALPAPSAAQCHDLEHLPHGRRYRLRRRSDGSRFYCQLVRIDRLVGSRSGVMGCRGGNIRDMGARDVSRARMRSGSAKKRRATSRGPWRS